MIFLFLLILHLKFSKVYILSFQLFVYISFTGPLSDILTDLSSTTSNSTGGAQSVSPNLPSHSPSQASIFCLLFQSVCLHFLFIFIYFLQAGPTRASTLHKLLMRKDQATRTRPSPVRSPDGKFCLHFLFTISAVCLHFCLHFFLCRIHYERNYQNIGSHKKFLVGLKPITKSTIID